MLKYKIPQIVTLTHVFYVYFAMCQKKNPCKVLIYRNFLCFTFFPAERRGFEPRIPFWGIHAFQACLFNHSSTSPFRGAKVKEVFETTKYLV